MRCVTLSTLLLLAACGGETGGSFAETTRPDVTAAPGSLAFAAPGPGQGHVDAQLTLTNQGGATSITRVTLEEDDSTVEVALLDAADWSGRPLGADDTAVLTLRWSVFDAQADSGRIRIALQDHEELVVPFSTVDVDPTLELETNPAGVESGTGIDVEVPSDIPRVTFTLRSVSIAPLSVQSICLVDGAGQCVGAGEENVFSLCDGARQVPEGCQAPQMGQSLPQSATYTFTGFFTPPPGTVDTFVGRVLVRTDSAQRPDVLVTLRATPCTRAQDGDVCGTCGDGQRDAGEECDDGNVSEDDGCDLFCQRIARCGDGVHDEATEACDDGNDIETDDCLTNCTLPACGDGFVWEGQEDCDDGDDLQTNGCLNDCTVAECGDGFVWEGEEACDDGDELQTNGCLNDCSVAECGDGFVWEGQEDCDDGDDVDDNECRNNCEVPGCGDGVVQDDEDCDDGNDIQTDACLNDCTDAGCGDGHVWDGEEDCDDGNDVQTDACLNDCTPADCGDGHVWEDEEDCDDGNDVQTDACLNSCEFADCGDGFLYDGVEACDDDNNEGGDGCSPTCELESDGVETLSEDGVFVHANFTRVGPNHAVVAYAELPDRATPGTEVFLRVVAFENGEYVISEPATVAQETCRHGNDHCIKLMGEIGPNHFLVVFQRDDYSDEIQLFRRDGTTVTRVHTVELVNKDWYMGHPIDDQRYLFRSRTGNSAGPVVYQLIHRIGDSIAFGNTLTRPAPSNFSPNTNQEPQTPAPLVRIGPNQFREMRGGYVFQPGYFTSWVLTMNGDAMSASNYQVHTNSQTRTMEPIVVGNGTGEALVFYSSYQNNWHYGHFSTGTGPFTYSGVLEDGRQYHWGSSRDSTDGYVDGVDFNRTRGGQLLRFDGVDANPVLVEGDLVTYHTHAPTLIEVAGHALMLTGPYDGAMGLRIIPLSP